MRLWDPVEFTQLALRLVPEILDPVDVILLLGKELRVIDPKVFEIRHIQRIVSLPAVSINDAVRDNLPHNDCLLYTSDAADE